MKNPKNATKHLLVYLYSLSDAEYATKKTMKPKFLKVFKSFLPL